MLVFKKVWRILAVSSLTFLAACGTSESELLARQQIDSCVQQGYLPDICRSAYRENNGSNDSGWMNGIAGFAAGYALANHLNSPYRSGFNPTPEMRSRYDYYRTNPNVYQQERRSYTPTPYVRPQAAPKQAPVVSAPNGSGRPQALFDGGTRAAPNVLNQQKPTVPPMVSTPTTQPRPQALFAPRATPAPAPRQAPVVSAPSGRPQALFSGGSRATPSGSKPSGKR